MATAPKHAFGHLGKPHKLPAAAAQEPKRDWLAALLAFLLIVVFAALIIWLAMIGGPVTEPDIYWPMM